MKALAFALALFAAGSVPAFAQTIASWTFETSVPVTAGPLAPEVGVGSALGFHAGASTYSSPVGDGSAHSFSSTTWATGDYYQFQVSTIGQSGISLSWDQTSSNTGPKDFKLAYSTNGTTFTDVASYAVLANGSPNVAWSSGTYQSAFHLNYSLSAAVDNQSAVYFRLIDTSTVSANGGVVQAGGTDRVDNFTVAAIPEPPTYALLLGSAGFAGVLLRRRRNAAQI